MKRKTITVQEAADDPTNVYQITVHGDREIAKLVIHPTMHGGWTHIEYANGGSETGCPMHWHQYVRYIDDPDEAAVREFYGDDAVALIREGWTIDSAIAHVTGTCDRELCGGKHIDVDPRLARFPVGTRVVRNDGSVGTVVQHVATYCRPADGVDTALVRWDPDTPGASHTRMDPAHLVVAL